MLTVLQQHLSDFAGAMMNNQCASKRLVRKIIRTSKISPQLAVDIYKNNTRGARLKSLEIIYPVCRMILGDQTFHLIGRQFAIEDTEGLSDLNYYGGSFNLHLKSLLQAGRLPEEYIYLSDLASLEYKMHAAYYADTDPVFPFKQFERKVKNNQQVYFKASSALALIASEYPVYEIWRSNKEQQYEEIIKPVEGRQYLLVYRNSYIPSIAVINENVYSVIKAITNNRSLQEIISNTDCDINRILPVLIANKWVVGIK